MKSVMTMLALVASMAALPVSAVNAASAGAARKLTFDVFLDDRAIGYQRFELMPNAEGLRIETQAEFKVKLLLITAFAYDHRNTEVWRDGCLQSIDARTDSNGKKYSVNGRVRGGEFVVAASEGDRRLGDECVTSFAYWDRDVLTRRQRLLNSQTGEYMTVRIDPLGLGRIRIADRDVAVERYAIKGAGLDITLAYASGSGDWVALDSRLDSGRTLRYRRSPGELGAPSFERTARAGGLEDGR